MIPFNKSIRSFDDVKQEYPAWFELSWLKYKQVKKFVIDELNILIEEELNRCDFEGEKPKHKQTLNAIYTSTAQAKAIYHYLWSIDHITDQMIKLGWKQKDIMILIKRMEKAGYDPYSITEDTAGRYIESIRGHGFKTVQTKNGDTFRVYDPRGYDEQTITDDTDRDNFNDEDDDCDDETYY